MLSATVDTDGSAGPEPAVRPAIDVEPMYDIHTEQVELRAQIAHLHEALEQQREHSQQQITALRRQVLTARDHAIGTEATVGRMRAEIQRAQAKAHEARQDADAARADLARAINDAAQAQARLAAVLEMRTRSRHAVAVAVGPRAWRLLDRTVPADPAGLPGGPKVTAGGRPVFTIVTPVYEPPLDVLQEMIDSVLGQTFQDWQLVLVDDVSPSSRVRGILRRAAAADGRITLIERSVNGRIVAASNDGAAAAAGEFLVLVDHDDLLVPNALEVVAAAIQREPLADYLYSDEDKVGARGEHYDLFRKPEWSPERLRGPDVHRSPLGVAHGTGAPGRRVPQRIRRITGP